MKHTIAVVGAGASGTLACAQLLRRSRQSGSELLVEWIGSPAPFGLGLAYGTRDIEHLLNVAARGMSAFPDESLHFFNWLSKTHPEMNATEHSFAPRMIYGQYLQSLVPESEARVRRTPEEAISVDRAGDHYRVRLKSGAEIEAKEVIIAIGNIQGKPGYGARFPRELDQVAGEASVLLIGTGLTMVDSVLSLQARGHEGPITAISRRGLVPRVHSRYRAHSPSAEFQALLKDFPKSLSQVLRVFRSECEQAAAAGSDWRAVFDLVREKTPELWSGLPLRSKTRFIRHMRPYWDVHRHRLAPEIHERLEKLQAAGQLRIRSARVISYRSEGSKTIFCLGERSGTTSEEAFDEAFDCTGLITRLSDAHSPLMKALLASGVLQLTDPPIGVLPGPDAPGVHVIGPLLRGSRWESVAIPEIRIQAMELAERLLP